MQNPVEMISGVSGLREVMLPARAAEAQGWKNMQKTVIRKKKNILCA